jgi:hypothetical protein
VLPYEVLDGAVHYAAINTTSATAILDTTEGFRDIDLSVGIVTGGSAGVVTPDPGNGTGALLFDVRCDSQCTASAGNQLMIVAVTSTSGSVDQSIVPIGTVNGTPCTSGGICQGLPAGLATSGFSYPPFAAKYTAQSTVRIGIYPKDFCAAVSAYTRTKPDFCSGADVIVPNAGTPLKTLDIEFHVISMGTAATEVPEIGSSAQKKALTLRFYDVDGGAVSNCPATPGPDFYFPSDHSILLEAGTFFTVTPASSVPPKRRILVFGNDGAPPDTTVPFAGNSLFQKIRTTGTQQVQGFTNSEPGDLHPYQLSFATINAAGLVSTNVCGTVTGIMATSVSGFLKAGNCFIATAAYRSPHDAAVERLRRFRDRVLSRSAAGRAFVAWYYDWSPGAAEWLMERPVLRVPVLWALLPIQAVAWLLLQPGLAMALALAGAAALLWARARPRRGTA